MNKGKLEVVKQEVARVNVDILGIRESRLVLVDLAWESLQKGGFI